MCAYFAEYETSQTNTDLINCKNALVIYDNQIKLLFSKGCLLANLILKSKILTFYIKILNFKI